VPPRWSRPAAVPVDAAFADAPTPDAAPDTAPGPASGRGEAPPTGVLMPFYLLLGLDDGHRAAGEKMIIALRDELATRPTASDHVRLGIIEFDTDARVRLPLSDPLDPGLRIPAPARRRTGEADGDEAGGTTGLPPEAAYAAALDAVYTAIAADVPALMTVSAGVRRPLVWLLVDRPPTDDPARRVAAFRALTGGEGYPFIVASGVGGVPDDDLRALLYPVQGDTVGAGYSASGPDAIETLGRLLTRTVLAFVGRVERSDDDVVLPGDDGLPTGVRRLRPAAVG
jgi:uncharacterized protein YegL